MRIAVFWGGRHTLPGACDPNTWYSFYNSGWKYGFESLGHSVDYFAWDDNADHPGYDLYIYAPGFLTNLTYHKNLHHPNVFFTEEISLAVTWAISHSMYYDNVCFLDYVNYKAVRTCGVKNVWWVPGAVDPTVFNDLGQDRYYNSAFLGTYDNNVVINNNQTRLDYVRTIDAKNKPSMVATGFYAFEANKIWNSTKIGVDVPIVEFASFRLFQIIAAGAFCLTRKPRIDTGIYRLLNEDEFGTYQDSNDLVNSVIPYWTLVDEKRTKMVAKARENVLNNHTFKERATQLLWISGLLDKPVKPEELLRYYGD